MSFATRRGSRYHGRTRSRGGTGLAVNKVNWAKVGRVTVPGRYMYKFGWLTITEQELAVWRQFPNASFTLYRPPAAETEDDFRLGVFELPEPSTEDPPTDSPNDSWPDRK
jgi:hypothetical protein